MKLTRQQTQKIIQQSFAFNAMNEKDLTQLVKNSDLLRFGKDKFIYQQNALASKIYILIEGSVDLVVSFGDGKEFINRVEVGDIFGVEIVDKDKHRVTSALALEDSVVLSISAENLERLFLTYPFIFSALTNLRRTLMHLLDKNLDWQQDDEIIVYMDHEHRYILWFRMLIPICIAFALNIILTLFNFTELISSNLLYLFAGISSFLCLCWSIWNAIDWSNDYYIITNKRVVFLERIALLYDSRRETPLTAILSFTKQSDQLGRWLNYGDITVRTYTGLLTLKNIESYEQICRLLEERWAKIKEKKDREDQQEIEKILRKNVLIGEIYRDDILKGEIKKQENINEGFQLDIFSRALGLRRVIADTIIYRTHWFVLLRKIIIPFIGLIGVLFTSLLVVLGFQSIPHDFLFRTLLIMGGIIFFFWGIYSIIDWRNDQYIIHPDQIVDVNRKPLGLEEKRAAPMKNIQTIEYKRLGVFGLLFNFGTVFIRVGDVEFTFDHVPDPSTVQQEIFERFIQVKEEEKENLSERERMRLARWMDTYHQIINEKQKTNSNPEE